MALEERRILASVELLYPTRTIHVKWLNQVVRTDDGVVIMETPHRCAYVAEEVPDAPDADRPFAAEAVIRRNVERFAERLEAETRARVEAQTTVAIQTSEFSLRIAEERTARQRSEEARAQAEARASTAELALAVARASAPPA